MYFNCKFEASNHDDLHDSRPWSNYVSIQRSNMSMEFNMPTIEPHTLFCDIWCVEVYSVHVIEFFCKECGPYVAEIWSLFLIGHTIFE